MSWLKKDSTPADTTSAQPTPSGDQPTRQRIRKGQSATLASTSEGEYTLVTEWGERDYDLYALVEYVDGHVETVSTFGTVDHPRGFSPRTKDDAVIHVSGDKAASKHRGAEQPYEVIHVRLNSQIRAIVPVVYSAKKSGVGSFHEYQVSTFVLEGLHEKVINSRPSVAVEAVDANTNRRVYSFVPAVIHNSADGPRIEAVELYSSPNNENRPVVKDGKVTMDIGPENHDKS